MPDDRKSWPSSAPVVPRKNSASQEHARKFLEDLFANGAHFEDCFRKICDSGCPPEEFGLLLCGTCMIMSIRSTPLLHAGKVSKAQLRGLPKRLRELAALIGALNASPMAPSNEIHFMPYIPEGVEAR